MHPVTLILGGARSGKSRYAQNLAQTSVQTQANSHDRVLFLATAAPSDDEMRAKIARHRADRAHLAHWTVVEEPLALAETIQAHGLAHGLILVDCLTLYAANLLALAPEVRDQNVAAFLQVLAAPPCPVLLVSNEVGSGLVPEYASGRAFRDLLGELNQRIAAIAPDVQLLVAGLPLALKSSASPAPQTTASRQP